MNRGRTMADSNGFGTGSGDNSGLREQPLRDRRAIACPRLILHVDADAFFASVEQALNPGLLGLPVIVGGQERGVVSAASYEARKFGVKSAMPTSEARRRCPHAIFMPPNFSAYKSFSKRMFDIMRIYSPLVEPTSIDEGYVELTGTLRLHDGPAWEVAHRILESIRKELTINVSGGLAGGKAAAKMATNLAKPNGLLYVAPGKEPAVLGALPSGAIPGVGKKAEARLRSHGIITISDLAQARPGLIRNILGAGGERLVRIAAGLDTSPVRNEPRGPQKSYSMERTLAEDTIDYVYLQYRTRELAERLAARLRRDGQGTAVVTVKIRYSDFTDSSKSASLGRATDISSEIIRAVDRLFVKTLKRNRAVRQVGVKLSAIAEPGVQLDLFDEPRTAPRNRDRAIDAIRSRHGFDAVKVPGWTPKWEA